MNLCDIYRESHKTLSVKYLVPGMKLRAINPLQFLGHSYIKEGTIITIKEFADCMGCLYEDCPSHFRKFLFENNEWELLASCYSHYETLDGLLIVE